MEGRPHVALTGRPPVLRGARPQRSRDVCRLSSNLAVTRHVEHAGPSLERLQGRDQLTVLGGPLTPSGFCRRGAYRTGALLMLGLIGPLVAAGCSTAGPPGPAATSNSPGPTTSASIPVPPSVIDCGTFALGQGEHWPSKATTCL